MKFYLYLPVMLCLHLLGLSSFVTADQPNSHLKLVHLVYRHGDRSPITTYPDDPNKDPENWPVEWGQLLNQGKMRQYKLGQFVRQHYKDFLSDSYDPQEIVIRSTDVDRTLMSAQSHLAGLFPPTDSQIWNAMLQWQPIPVHTVPQKEDYLLTLEAVCPRYEKLKSELESSKEITDILEDNKDLFTYLSKNSGENVTTLTDLEYLYDTLFIEARYNKTLPEWTTSVFPAQMKPLSDFSFAMKAYTPAMQRLRGGPLVKEIVSHLQDFVGSKLVPSSRKLFMYSAHDVTLAVLLSAMKIFNNIQPPYASLVMVELHQSVSPQEYFVQILYKNVTEGVLDPYLLTVPGCTPLCPLDKFVQLTEAVIADDIQEECGLPSLPANDILTLVIGVLSMLSCILLLIVVLGAVFMFRKQRNPSTYSSIQSE